LARSDHTHAITGFATGTGSASGANTADVTLATNSGLSFTSANTLLTIGTPTSVGGSSTNSVTTNTHSHAVSGLTYSNFAASTVAANSIVGNATTGATVPTDIAIPASTFVGRIATGNVIAMTTTQARTLLNVADGATANIGTVQKYSTTIGDASATSFVLTHGFNTRDVIVQIAEAGTPWARVETDVEITSLTTVTVRFTVAPSSGQYRVNIMS
jgi:hypothetical protein